MPTRGKKAKSKDRSNPRTKKGPSASRDEELNLWTAADDDEVEATAKRRLSSSSDTYNFLDSPTSIYRKPRKPTSIVPLGQKAPTNVRKSFQLNPGTGKSLATKFLDVYTS